MQAIAETRGKYVGHGNRAGLIAHPLHAPRHKRPCQPEYFAEYHPVGLRADGVAHAGQAEQQPAGLAGCVHAERDDPERQLLAREKKAGH